MPSQGTRRKAGRIGVRCKSRMVPRWRWSCDPRRPLRRGCRARISPRDSHCVWGVHVSGERHAPRRPNAAVVAQHRRPHGKLHGSEHWRSDGHVRTNVLGNIRSLLHPIESQRVPDADAWTEYQCHRHVFGGHRKWHVDVRCKLGVRRGFGILFGPRQPAPLLRRRGDAPWRVAGRTESVDGQRRHLHRAEQRQSGPAHLCAGHQRLHGPAHQLHLRLEQCDIAARRIHDCHRALRRPKRPRHRHDYPKGDAHTFGDQ